MHTISQLFSLRSPYEDTSEMLNPYAAWPALAQVYRLQRQFQWWRKVHCCRTSRQVEVGITSLSRQKASPKRLLHLRRAHWNIETGLHYPRDVTFHEDATRMTVGNTGPVMACIDNLVVALIKQANFTNAAQARRSFAGHISQEFFSAYHARFRTLRKPWIERLRALREWGPVLK